MRISIEHASISIPDVVEKKPAKLSTDARVPNPPARPLSTHMKLNYSKLQRSKITFTITIRTDHVPVTA